MCLYGLITLFIALNESDLFIDHYSMHSTSFKKGNKTNQRHIFHVIEQGLDMTIKEEWRLTSNRGPQSLGKKVPLSTSFGLQKTLVAAVLVQVHAPLHGTWSKVQPSLIIHEKIEKHYNVYLLYGQKNVSLRKQNSNIFPE